MCIQRLIKMRLNYNFCLQSSALVSCFCILLYYSWLLVRVHATFSYMIQCFTVHIESSHMITIADVLTDKLLVG